MKDMMCGPGHEVDHSELPVTNLVCSESDSDATPDRELDAWFERITADDNHPATITGLTYSSTASVLKTVSAACVWGIWSIRAKRTSLPTTDT